MSLLKRTNLLRDVMIPSSYKSYPHMFDSLWKQYSSTCTVRCMQKISRRYEDLLIGKGTCTCNRIIDGDIKIIIQWWKIYFFSISGMSIKFWCLAIGAKALSKHVPWKCARQVANCGAFRSFIFCNVGHRANTMHFRKLITFKKINERNFPFFYPVF